MLTIGPYLQPSPHHLPVERYVEPAVFEAFQREYPELAGSAKDWDDLLRQLAAGMAATSRTRGAEDDAGKNVDKPEAFTGLIEEFVATLPD